MTKYSNTTASLVAVFLIFHCSHKIEGQSRSFAGLPIMTSKNRNSAESIKNLKNSPEYARMITIYEKLVEAKGDRSMPVPKLTFNTGKQYAASMDYRLTEIAIEKSAYDVAAKYGDAAIAFLLGHELIHYYEKHGWKSDYQDEVFDLETSKALRNINDKVVNEVQADVLGGFLAYSAGFGVFDKGGMMINDLYAAYEFEDNLEGYPSKKDRITLAERNKRQIEKLSNMYEMAGLLTVIGKYEEAYSYYGYLLNKYQSRELYNNAGLTCMMHANSQMDPDSVKFVLPGILDLEFSEGSREASSFEVVNKLLDEAINHFETSILMNKAYLPAYINKVSALILKSINNKSEKAIHNINLKTASHVLEEELEELKILQPKLDITKYKDEILILKAILAYYKNDKSTAMSLMTQSAEMGNETAKVNLAILKNGSTTLNDVASEIKIDIDGMTAEKFLAQQIVSNNFTLLDSFNIFRIIELKNKNFKTFTHEFKGNDQDVEYELAFLMSKNTFTGEFAPGIKLGSDKKAILEILGKPKRVWSHVNGEILNFNDSIIIITNRDAKIEKVIDYIKN